MESDVQGCSRVCRHVTINSHVMWILEQGPLRIGAECWVLFPGSGVRPVAEGIAGSTPSTQSSDCGKDRSFLMTLCEAGQQSVTITGVYKKNVELMFLHANSAIRYLEQVVTAPAVGDKTIVWSVRYLVDKATEIQPPNSHPEHPALPKLP